MRADDAPPSVPDRTPPAAPGTASAPVPSPHGGPRPRRAAAGSAARAGRRLRGGDLLIALVLAAAAVGVAFTFRSALVATDPYHYVQGALSFPEPVWRPAGFTRWGFLVPIMPFARLWGDATATYYAVPLINTGVLAAVLYLLGTRYVSRVVGVLGVLMVLATPLVFINLSRGYTDLTATTLVATAILLVTLAADAARRPTAAPAPSAPPPPAGPMIVEGFRRSSDTNPPSSAAREGEPPSNAPSAAREGEPPSPEPPTPATRPRWGWRVPVLLMAAGFFTGWSFEVREIAIFAWPVIGWVLLTMRRPLRTLAWFAPPALAWLALDLYLCNLVYGDPLTKFRLLLGADIAFSEVSGDAVYVGHSRGWYMTVLPRTLWGLAAGPTLTVLLVVGMIGGLVFRRQLGRIWAWGMLSLTLLWLQGGAVDPGHPSVRLDIARYSLSFIVPLMLTCVGTLVILVQRSRGGWRIAALATAAVAGAAMLVPSARFVDVHPALRPNGGDALAQLRTELTRTGGMPDEIVWSDWATRRVLPAYQRGPFGEPAWQAGAFRSLSWLIANPPARSSGYPQPGSYVLVYSTKVFTCAHCHDAGVIVEGAFGPFPGPGWQEVFTSSTGNLTLYRLGPDAIWPELPEGT